MRTRFWSALVTAILVGAACGGTPAPPSTSSSGGTQQNVGRVEFLSSQGQPAKEVQDMNDKVLKGFGGTATPCHHRLERPADRDHGAL